MDIEAERRRFELELDELISSRTPEDAEASRNLNKLRGLPTLSDDPQRTATALARLSELPPGVIGEHWGLMMLPRILGFPEVNLIIDPNGHAMKFSETGISSDRVAAAGFDLSERGVRIEIEGMWAFLGRASMMNCLFLMAYPTFMNLTDPARFAWAFAVYDAGATSPESGYEVAWPSIP